MDCLRRLEMSRLAPDRNVRAGRLRFAKVGGGTLMSVKQHGSLTASCRCGAVVLEVTGAPIVHTACYCASCQEPGRQIEQLPDAPPILDADGGTGFVLYRK